jgi:hypothetical protein
MSVRQLQATESLAHNAAAVVPHNDNDLAQPTRALWVGGAGTVAVDTVGGQTVTFTGVPAGTLLRVAVRRVRATGTSATNILALW